MHAIRLIPNARRLVTRIALVAILLALGAMAPAPHAQAAQMLPVESLLNPDGTLNTSTGASGALDLRGWNVTLDSVRGPILTRDAPAPAALLANAWSALSNNGLNNWVNALAVSGSDLYVGGGFTQTVTGGITLNHIAKYSGGAWSALAHNGLDNYVDALAVSGSDLYVGGTFTQSADGTVTNLRNIAKYSGGAWSALSNNGLNGSVYSLAASGSDLYVGGQFASTFDGTVKNLIAIAKYSGGAWSALANKGLNSAVFALAVSGSDLYVGGTFTQTADGTVTNLRNIAKYSGGAWSALSNNGLNGSVEALAVSGNDLYVGGVFTQTVTGGITLNNIAKYSGGTWAALSNNGLKGGLGGVRAFAESGSDLYVGGDFTQTADGTVTNLNRIARYGSGTWSALARNGLTGGSNPNVSALAVSGSDLYVGGNFLQTADGTVTNLNRIAKMSLPTLLYLPYVSK